MKKGKYLFSVLILVLSVIACSFAYVQNNKQPQVYAANSSDCYYLIGQDGVPYQANVPVGTIDGAGEYLVGETNVPLKAKAKNDFQIVGWQISYLDQGSRTAFVDMSSLVDNKKDIVLTDKDGFEISATIEFTFVDNNATESTFTLSYIFENLIVRPVFDHIYYFVDVNEIANIAKISSNKQIGSDMLLYEEETTIDGVTKYSNAVIYRDESYFFYGDLYFKGGKYFTKHNTLNDAKTEEEIDYQKGAFRAGDEISSSFNINIIANDIQASENIDLIGVSVVGNQVVDLTKTNDDLSANTFKIYKDIYERTISVDVDFTIISNSRKLNTIELNYHRLYVADLVVLIDGNNAGADLVDVLGNVENKRNEILGNISIYNFYAKTNENNLQFLFKKSHQNQGNAFRIVCVDAVSKFVDNASYRYYNFESIDGSDERSASYANVNNNITITINYVATKYEIAIYCAEYQNDGQNVTLSYMNGAEVEPLQLKRGESVLLDADFVEDVHNVGYRFKGFALGLDATVQDSILYTVNKQKPQNATIFICYEKIEYNIIFANYNKVTIGELIALNSVTFSLDTGVDTLTESLIGSDLTGESTPLSLVAKVGNTISISHFVNAGFYVWGYSIKAPENVEIEDYTNNFIIDADFITSNNIEDTIIIYIYEDLIKYSVTYYIETTLDSTLDEMVIMANINAVYGHGATIEKYDVNNNLISHANANLDAIVAKIVISNLKINDEVVLTSAGLTVGEDEDAYSYVFNWFTEDNKSTLSFEQDGNVYSHTEVVRKNRSIKVVYSMPSTKVFVTIDDELASNQYFTFDYALTGDTVMQDIENVNLFTMAVGTEITVQVTNIAFGYKFVGCECVEFNEVININDLQFTYITKVGVNTLKLDFEQIKYHFVFSQYGAGFDGDKIEFDGTLYVELDVDNSAVSITKPLGYYVSNVKFNNQNTQYSYTLSETNNYRLVDDISKFDFAMEREEFIDIVTNYGKTNLGHVEVGVQLEYSIFTYQITVNYGITNPKGLYDNYVAFPEMIVEYEYESETYTIQSDYVEINKIQFASIPYGAEAIIKVIGATPAGFSLFGWTYANNAMVPEADHSHSLGYLRIDSVITDKDFKYLISYNAYNVVIVNAYGIGSPEVYINDVIKVRDAKISLYDKLKILTNASRENGYTYDEISYKQPVYSVYTYSDATWLSLYESLYVKIGDDYVLNNDDVYNANKQYYVYSEKIITITEELFTDDLFLVSNYALENGKTITFTIKYKLLDLTIENTIVETSANDRQGWSLTSGRGPDKLNPIIKFNSEDLAIIKVMAVNAAGEERLIENGTFVNFYDTIKVNVQINQEATNIDGKKYDLTLGLTLKSVTVQNRVVTTSATGEVGGYAFTFNMGEYMPEEGQEIAILYTLYIETQQVYTTTIVTNSATFYENIKFTIDARTYDFSKNSLTSDKTASISQNLQFLAKADVKADLLNTTYRENFVVSGAYVYCDGQLIAEADDEAYGIERLYDRNDKGVRCLTKITSVLMRNLKVVFIVQPQITYNRGPEFTKTFICDENGNGVAQQLTVGSTNDCDIQVDSTLKNAITITYKLAVEGAYATSSVTNVGRYNVTLAFTNNDDFDWLSEISVAEKVVLIIEPKPIYLDYDRNNIEQVEKIYNGSSAYSVQNVQKYLMFTDGKTDGFSIKYSTALQNQNLILLNTESYIAYAYPGGLYAEIAKANENVYYDVYLFNFVLQNTEFNKNFVLKNNDLKIQQIVKIVKKEITIHNVNIYSKVYDGTDKAEFNGIDNITISGIIKGDDVSINLERLNPRFENSSVGTNKKVKLDAGNALVGADISNYYIEEVQVEGLKIHPYSLSVNIAGVGIVEVENRRGLTEKDKVELIPLEATLIVNPIYEGDNNYANMYPFINKSLKGNNEFAIGYEIYFLINGQKSKIDNNLYLTIPYVKNLTGAYFLTGQQSGAVTYTSENGKMVIDLSQVNGDVNHVYLTKTKILLKAWQIVLIVVGSVLLLAGVVIVFIIIRKRKVDRDSVHEKI